jgi:hypothetical protein
MIDSVIAISFIVIPIMIIRFWYNDLKSMDDRFYKSNKYKIGD